MTALTKSPISECLPDCVVVVGDGAAGDGGGGGGGHVGAELGQVGRGDRLQAQRLDGAHLDEQLVEQYPGKNLKCQFCRSIDSRQNLFNMYENGTWNLPPADMPGFLTTRVFHPMAQEH